MNRWRLFLFSHILLISAWSLNSVEGTYTSPLGHTVLILNILEENVFELVSCDKTEYFRHRKCKQVQPRTYFVRDERRGVLCSKSTAKLSYCWYSLSWDHFSSDVLYLRADTLNLSPGTGYVLSFDRISQSDLHD